MGLIFPIILKWKYNIDIIDSILEYQYNPKPCPWIPWI